jgi:hypothetical protein
MPPKKSTEYDVASKRVKGDFHRFIQNISSSADDARKRFQHELTLVKNEPDTQQNYTAKSTQNANPMPPMPHKGQNLQQFMLYCNEFCDTARKESQKVADQQYLVEKQVEEVNKIVHRINARKRRVSHTDMSAH